MAERAIDLLKSDELSLKTEKFIDGVAKIQGVIRLVLAKYNNGDLRFYAIWRSGIDMDQKLVQDVWQGLFTRESYPANGDPLIIQYSENEFEEKVTKSSQWKNMLSATIWDRSNESC